jgi:hypothetical protein
MRFSAVLAFSLALAWASAARAQDNSKPTSNVSEYSPYEKEAADIALKELHLKVDPKPEGKRIRKITSVRLQVLEPRDPGPELLKPIPILSPLGTIVTKPMLNWLHITTKEYIIRREMLIREGDAYQQIWIDETARNIRARMPFQVSLVVILPIQTDDPNTVDILLLTKDIWSLRLSFNIVGTTNGVEDFTLVPQETNFLGLQHTVSTSFRYQPETLAFGVGYKIPRFGFTWFGAGASAGVIINRHSGSPEGANIALSAGKSLYSTKSEWAYDGDIGFSSGISRRYSSAQVLLFDSRATPQRDNIPWQYRSEAFSASASLTRSFGWGFKNNFSLSANASTANYSPFGIPAGTDPAARAAFERLALPTSENRVYPSIGWRTFKNDFVRRLDVNTLGLQEDFRMGHDISATFYPVFRALGSSRDLFGLSLKAGYAIPIGDGFVGASASTFAEDHEGHITDGAVSASFGAATPRFKVGRFVMNTSWSNRYRNYLNSRAVVGGEDRLRGYPTGFFSGKDTVFLNMEYRSRAVELLKAQIGGVLFMDSGDAADGVKNLQPKQSVGFGVRVLLPQINRNVFRLDMAFPIQRGPFADADLPTRVAPFGIFFSFDQAFSP